MSTSEHRPGVSRPPRAGARRRVAAFAIAALLVQPFLPHLHAVQDLAHASPARVVGAAPAAAGVEAGAVSWRASRHADAACAVCRALAQARIYVGATAVALARDATRVKAAGAGAAQHVRRATVRHAPRSPPLSA